MGPRGPVCGLRIPRLWPEVPLRITLRIRLRIRLWMAGGAGQRGAQTDRSARWHGAGAIETYGM